MMAGWGWVANLVVYLIQEFNVKSIDATQINNVVQGSTNIIPIIGAVLADSFLGSFHVVSIFSLLGIVVLSLTATLGYLRPEHCETGSTMCHGPSKLQLGVLYTGITLASIGFGGFRFVLATFGANQFDNPKDQGVFFNWFFIAYNTVSALSSLGIVYIEDNVSWGLGFGICAAFNLLGLLIFNLGKRFYRHDKPQGSPYTSLARVIVAAIRKRRLLVSSESIEYYHDNTDGANYKPAIDATVPKRSFRFLNRAAMKTEGDIKPDGTIAKPWRLCSVQQVEDLKTLIRIFPLWSSSIFLVTPLAIQANMTVLQALAMDRHLGPNFKVSAGSLIVVVLISGAIFIFLLDRFLFPTWRTLTGRSVTPLQRIGMGHFFCILSMGIAALVESKRLKIAHDSHLSDQQQVASIVPMLVIWLFPQLIVGGIGEAFYLPGTMSLYYQDFPVSMKNTGTSTTSIFLAIAFYVSTAVFDLIRKVTGWLPDDINHGRLDNVY